MKKNIKQGFLSFDKSTGEVLNYTQNKLRLDNAGLGFRINGIEAYNTLQKQYPDTFGKESLNLTSLLGSDDAESIIPKDSEFVKVPFRLLSATIVGAGGWKATDFTDEKVLKKATKLLMDKPVYTDHDTYTVNNAIGKVFETSWQEGYTDTTGQEIPAGINGIVGVDVKVAPKTARNLLSGAINSNSVTVMFDWVPSHEFDNEWDFRDLLGSVIDGKMVTRKVTKIYDFFETSLVFLGADPFSKKLDDSGQPMLVDKSAVFKDETKLVRESYMKEGKFSVSGFSKNTYNPEKCDEHKFLKSFNMNKKQLEVLSALGVLLGLEEGSEPTLEDVSKLTLISEVKDSEAGIQAIETLGKITSKAQTDLSLSEDADVTEVITKSTFVDSLAYATQRNELADTKLKLIQLAEVEVKLTKAEEKLTKTTEELTKATNLNVEYSTELDKKGKIIEDLAGSIKEKEELAKIGLSFIDKKRQETVDLYTKAVKGKTDEAVLGMFAKATTAELDGLLAQYVTKLTTRFTGTCKSCGSADFEFRSSLVAEEEKEAVLADSIDEIHANLI